MTDAPSLGLDLIASGINIQGRGIIYGVGSPNGSVAASVGTVYRDVNGTNGAFVWEKINGSGNTGWRVSFGDTGYINITHLIPPENITQGQVYIRRLNDRIILRCDNLENPVANAVIVRNFRGEIGTGFEAPENISAIVAANSAGAVTTSFRVSPASTLTGLVRVDSGARSYMSADWACVTAWPATLPTAP